MVELPYSFHVHCMFTNILFHLFFCFYFLLVFFFPAILVASFKPHDCFTNMPRHKTKHLFSFSGQQWSEENQVGRLPDRNGDFEGNGIFSKLLLDVSLFYLN